MEDDDRDAEKIIVELQDKVLVTRIADPGSHSPGLDPTLAWHYFSVVANYAMRTC